MKTATKEVGQFSWSYLLSALGTCVGYFPWILFQDFGRDWRWFNSLSLFVRSSVLHYQAMPLHDPWFCGGLNVLANPQNRIFSPLLLFDLVLPPMWAHVVGLFFFSLFGHWGMARLLGHWGYSKRVSWLGGFLWIYGSWFALHFAEGHMTFGSFLLYPWVALAILNWNRRSYFLLFSFLLAFFLLDGAFYTCVFSAFLFLWILAIQLWEKKPLYLFHDLWFRLAALLGAVFLSSPKWLPVLIEKGSHAGDEGVFPLSLSLILRTLFFPFEQVGGPDFQFGMHELGGYVGLLSFCLIVGMIWKERHEWRTKRWPILLFNLFFWLFVASAWLPTVNPWNAIFQKIPVFNNLHVQSRLMLLVALSAILLVAEALQSLNVSRWVIVILILEFVVVRNYPVFQVGHEKGIPSIGYRLIESTTLKETIPGSRDLRDSEHYFRSNTGSRECYEPVGYVAAAIPGKPAVESSNGKTTLKAWQPGSWVIEHAGASPNTLLTLNQAHHSHFTVTSGNARVVSMSGERLQIELQTQSDRTELSFRPFYWPWVLIAQAIGALLLCWLWRKREVP